MKNLIKGTHCEDEFNNIMGRFGIDMCSFIVEFNKIELPDRCKVRILSDFLYQIKYFRDYMINLFEYEEEDIKE